MSEIETSMPSRAAILSVIGGLESLSPTPSTSAPAAAPSPPPSLLDALQSEIETLRGDRDGMRVELRQHREQIAHLGAAIASLLEIANSRVAATASAPAATASTAPILAAPTAQQPVDSIGYALPPGMAGLPSTQPPPPPVDPNAAPMVIPSLAPEPPRPPRRRPIRAVQPVAPRIPAETIDDPVVDELPLVMTFTAPEPQGALAEILPHTNQARKRRLRIG